MNLFDLPCDEEAAFIFLQERGIMHHERFCGNGHPMSVRFNPSRWRCSTKSCRKETGLRTKTWLEGDRMSFVAIVRFIYAWAFEYTTIDFSAREIGVNKNTVVDWNNMLREVCAQHLLANPIKIGGAGCTVEIDESVFSKKRDDRSRLPQQWVFGGVCRETKETFLFAVSDRTEHTLMECVKETIVPGSHIISDCWRPYLSGIPKLVDDEGAPLYSHAIVNHSEHLVKPKDGSRTSNIQGVWNVAKAAGRRRWGTHRSVPDSYLCEFMWRRRHLDRDPFDVILSDIVAYNPPK